MEKDHKLENILRQLDDGDWLEFPRDYSEPEMSAAFDNLIGEIETLFSKSCEIDRNIQDSAQYGRIEIPANATVCGTRIVVLVSRFKPLAVISADNPGAFYGTDEAVSEGELDAKDLKKVEQVLHGQGYVVMPEELLMSSYDGLARLRFHGSGAPTWWDRFFGSF